AAGLSRAIVLRDVLVAGNRAAHECVGVLLTRESEPERARQLLAHRAEDLIVEIELDSLIIERRDVDGANLLGKSTAALEAVVARAADHSQRDDESEPSARPKVSRHQ